MDCERCLFCPTTCGINRRNTKVALGETREIVIPADLDDLVNVVCPL